MKRELTLSPEPPTTIAELRQRVQDDWDNRWMTFDTCIAARGRYTVYSCDCVSIPYCDMGVSFGLHMLSYTVEPRYSELMGGVICSNSEMFGLSEKKMYLCKYSFRISSHKAKHRSDAGRWQC